MDIFDKLIDVMYERYEKGFYETAIPDYVYEAIDEIKAQYKQEQEQIKQQFRGNEEDYQALLKDYKQLQAQLQEKDAKIARLEDCIPVAYDIMISKRLEQENERLKAELGIKTEALQSIFDMGSDIYKTYHQAWEIAMRALNKAESEV
ncbi:MAG: hypothetical protein ACM3KR_01045 [Deltaproteobacteria bacterium]